MRYLFCLLLVIICSLSVKSQQYFQTDIGEINFISDAPLEVIKAQSNNLRGIIDREKNTFAFALNINSFEGFNSPLQKEHFNENYLESGIYPEATFTGKIIEKDILSQKGEFTIRAKGKLAIHGIEQERIIKCKVIIDDESIQINSFFTVFLDDHGIRVPKIVFQKISEEIQIHLNAKLQLVE